MSPSSKRVAFFGATGGCALSSLSLSLQAGSQCRVLARDPDKQLRMLQDRLADPSVLSSAALETVKGDVKDVESVKRTLSYDRGDGSGGAVVDVIICGIGCVNPYFQLSLTHPLTFADPRTCSDGTSTILAALTALRADSQTTQSGAPPLLVLVSTVGLATTYREFPLLMYPFYRWLLNTMMDDKRLAHEAVLAAANTAGRGEAARRDPSSGGGPLVRYVSVRPSHLEDGASKGLEAVRAGVGNSSVRGYWISREDVGLWMFERFVKGSGGEYVNRDVVITY